MNKLPYDKLYAKYFAEPDAYKELTQYFLEHKDYTHMCIIPDDLIVDRVGFEILMLDLQEHDYPALEGICNLSFHQTDKFACGPTISGGPSFFSEQSLKLEIEKQHSEIIQVQSESFCCLFIRRDMLEKYPHLIKGMPNTSFDWGFSTTCFMEGIPMRVDTRARFLHLAGRAQGYLEYFYRGKKVPCVRFEDGQGRWTTTVKQGLEPVFVT